jgi:hypothetical protein
MGSLGTSFGHSYQPDGQDSGRWTKISNEHGEQQNVASRPAG